MCDCIMSSPCIGLTFIVHLKIISKLKAGTVSKVKVVCGRHKEATTDENGGLVHSMIMCSRRRSLHDIGRRIGIGFG